MKNMTQVVDFILKVIYDMYISILLFFFFCFKSFRNSFKQNRKRFFVFFFAVRFFCASFLSALGSEPRIVNVGTLSAPVCTRFSSHAYNKGASERGVFNIHVQLLKRVGNRKPA